MPLTFNAAGDAELSATLHNRRPSIIDNIFDGTAYLNAMRTYGGVDIDSTGGVGLVRALRFDKQDSVKAFAGAEQFTVPSEHDDETSGNWPWASLWAHVTIPWDEETRNSGMAQLINLVNMKVDGAEISLRDFLNEQLFQTQPPSSSEGDKEMISLTEILDVLPSGNPPRGIVPLGGIDQSVGANSWVRNVFSTGAAWSKAAMTTVYNDASDGHDPPHFLLANQSGYETYEAAEVQNIRYSAGPVIDGAASALLFKSTPVVWDPNVFVPQNTHLFYGINTTYHKLVFHVRGQFATSNFIEADNGAYKTAKILVMAQHFSTNRRRGFVYTST